MIENFWNSFVDWWPWGDKLLITFVLFVGHSGIPMIYNAIALCIYRWPSLKTEEWKIQKGIYAPWRLVWDTVKQVLFNHFLTTPLLVYLLVAPAFQFFEMPIRDPLPSIGRIIFEFFVCSAVNDTLFYWSHRLLHHPRLFSTFHAQHHRFNIPMSWSAEYCSPLESILSNSLPTILGCFIVKMHLFTMNCWISFRLVQTLEAHSGFVYPFSPFRMLDPLLIGPKGHDFHHSHNRGNYGIFKFWDWICGTDREYKEWLMSGKGMELSSQLPSIPSMKS